MQCEEIFPHFFFGLCLINLMRAIFFSLLKFTCSNFFCMLKKCRKNIEKADVRMFDCKVVISVYKLTAIFLFIFYLLSFLK